MLPLSRSGALIIVWAVTMTTAAAQQSADPEAQSPAPTMAQHLVDEFVRTHKLVSAVELALDSAGTCKTFGATDRSDVGLPCDADEKGPMRTGKPDIAKPTQADPVYDITQALHDTSGHLIGAVGMDIPPAPGQDEAAVLSVAQGLLRKLEAQIPSKEWLFQPARQ